MGQLPQCGEFLECLVPENIHTITTLKIRASECNVFFFFSKFQSGDDNEELTQGLNGNQNYENGDIEMDAGFEGEYCQQLILLSDTFMHQLITRLLISFLWSLDPFIFSKTAWFCVSLLVHVHSVLEGNLNSLCPLGKQLSCFACPGQLLA